MSAPVVLSEIWIHPVKSCRGIRVQRAKVEHRGLADDRRYMIVDDDGRFVTLREEPLLVRIGTELSGDGLRLSYGDETVMVPRRLDAGERVPVEVWDDTVEALVEADGSAWLSRALGRSLRLVYMPDDVRRSVNPKRAVPGRVVSFADAYPLLLVSQASVDEASTRYGRPLEVARFRPNLVVTGLPPHGEDALETFSLGSLTFRNVKPCTRCVAITRDPVTGESDPDVTRTLAQYRTFEGAVLFGVNLLHEGRGELKVGDALS